MVNKWLHVAEAGSDPWILPIWNSINKAVSKGLCKDIDNECREIGIHVSTRLNMLPEIISRINNEWKELFDNLNYKDENIFSKDKEGYAILVDKALLNKLLLDINSFLFEINSCCELMQILLGKIYKHRNIQHNPNNLGNIMKDLLINEGQNPYWFRLLDNERNVFMHIATPYIAIDITDADHPILIIMKENLYNFNNKDKYITLKEMNDIVAGFNSARVILQLHLMELYSEKFLHA